MSRFCWMLLCAGLCLQSQLVAKAQSAPDNTPVVLHLEDALALANTANRQEAITRIGITQAQASVKEARTYFYPQLKASAVTGVPIQEFSFTIPAGTLGTYPGIGPLPATNSQIKSPQQFSGVIYASAQQPLTQLYKVHLAVAESKLGIISAKEQFRQSHQEIARQVRESYYSISQAQAQLRVTEITITYLRQLSVETQNNLAQQTVLKSDAMTVTSNLKNAEFQHQGAEDSLALKKENLNYLLARPLQTDFTVDEDPQPTLQELDLDEAIKEALAQRPELRLARLQEQQAEFEVRRERAEYIPDITAGITFLAFPNVNFLPSTVSNLGITFQWQPFDWGQKKQRIVNLKGSSAQATLKTADTEQQIRLNVDQAFRRLRRSRLQLAAESAALDAEQERFREAQNQYQQKAILLSDLMKEESAVEQAVAHYTDAVTEFWTAKAEFAKALGED
jgi:outer membrane protein